MKVNIHPYSMRDEGWFPRTVTIPTDKEADFRRHAQSNHSQTVERLNERGGLSPVEIYMAYHGVKLSFSQITPKAHIRALQLCVSLAEGETK